MEGCPPVFISQCEGSIVVKEQIYHRNVVFGTREHQGGPVKSWTKGHVILAKGPVILAKGPVILAKGSCDFIDKRSM